MKPDNVVPMSKPNRDDDSIIELTERERLIAQEAARLAVKQMTDNFYKEVGRSFISKFLIVLGAGVVGYMSAKGYVKIP